MELRLIHTFDRFWTSGSRHGVEIQFDGLPKETFFMSDKQYSKLVRSFGEWAFSDKYKRVFAVLDGDRYVWCGVDIADGFSELPALCEHFGIDSSLSDGLTDPHIESLKNPEPVEHDDLKN